MPTQPIAGSTQPIAEPATSTASAAAVDALSAIVKPAAVTLLGAEGLGFQAVPGDGTSRRLTGTTDAEILAFNVTAPAAGRSIAGVDVLATVVSTGAAAIAKIYVVPQADLANDDNWTLPAAIEVMDVPTAVVFFYDLDGNSVTTVDDTHIKIDVSDAVTDTDVRDATIAAIDAVPGILWNAYEGFGGTFVEVQRLAAGADLNGTPLPEDVGHAGFTTEAVAGGIDAKLASLTCTVETVDLTDSPIRTTLAACPDPVDHDEPGVEKTLEFVPADHDVAAGATVLVTLSAQLHQVPDSITILGATITFD